MKNKKKKICTFVLISALLAIGIPVAWYFLPNDTISTIDYIIGTVVDTTDTDTDDEPEPIIYPDTESFYVAVDKDNGEDIVYYEIESGSSFAEPEEPIKEGGYIFDNWLSTIAYTWGEEVEENFTITAQWIKTYQVTLNYNDELFDSEAEERIEIYTIERSDALLLPHFDLLEGTPYIFKGWKEVETENIYNDYIQIQKDYNLKAYYASIYTVLFDLDGGVLISGELIQTIEEGQAATAPTIERNGYTFTGWDVAFSNITSNLTVVAQWEEIIISVENYTVMFNLNGGTLVSGDLIQTIEEGQGAVAPVVEKTGYTFTGWNVAFSNINSNLTVVAQWEEIIIPAESYTVTFNLNGGVLVSGELIQTIEEGQSAVAPVVEKDGYTLNRWSVYFDNITSNTSVFAIWQVEVTEGLAAPQNLRVEDNTLIWDAVDGADVYYVYKNTSSLEDWSGFAFPASSNTYKVFNSVYATELETGCVAVEAIDTTMDNNHTHNFAYFELDLLDEVQNIEYNSQTYQLTWEAVENVGTYQLIINNSFPYIDAVTNSYDLTSYFSNGEANIEISISAMPAENSSYVGLRNETNTYYADFVENWQTSAHTPSYNWFETNYQLDLGHNLDFELLDETLRYSVDIYYQEFLSRQYYDADAVATYLFADYETGDYQVQFKIQSFHNGSWVTRSQTGTISFTI